jgi:hypothetical protein
MIYSNTKCKCIKSNHLQFFDLKDGFQHALGGEGFLSDAGHCQDGVGGYAFLFGETREHFGNFTGELANQ